MKSPRVDAPIKPEPDRIPCGRAVLWFVAANAVLLPLIFGSALWGRALLAPIDLPPVLFPKFESVDPQHGPVPANHFIIDGVTYDLPVQKLVHEAYQRGEMPWWDPYSLGGRPLLADAHINGTDFTRVALYRLLPFELAYNWTRVLHYFFTGLGALLLLRHLRGRLSTCLWLALAFEFSAGFAVQFCHPWVQASFLFYPCLWLLWDGASSRPLGWREGAAGLLAAGVFSSGNLQSHAYLPLFGLAFCLGYGGRSFAAWKRAVTIVAVTGVIGACLAAPVLLNEVELYVTGVRFFAPKTAAEQWRACLSGVFSLSAVYPWMLGTFRSLDVGKLAGESGLGFAAYTGSVMIGVAAVSFFLPAANEHGRVRRMALWLLVLYFGLILSTPLKAFLYTRSSGLAMLAIVVLAGLTLERLRGATADAGMRRAGICVLTITTAIVVTTHAGALLIYPRVIERVRAKVSARVEPTPALRTLRELQIQNWPREVTFRNPEPLFAAGGLLSLSALLWSLSLRRTRGAWSALLVLNLVPLLLFAHRFVPRHPVERWQRLQAGGPEHQRVAAAVGPEERVLEKAPWRDAQLFPNEMQHFQRIRTIHGYAALQPRGPAVALTAESGWSPEQLADWVYETRGMADTTGTLRRASSAPLARFQWPQGIARALRVESQGLNRIRVAFASGPEADLLWTDSPYPGWRATIDGRPAPLAFVKPCFSAVRIPATAGELVLEYRPSWLRVGVVLAGFGLAGVALCGAAGRRTRRTLFEQARGFLL